jgi:hypothetical protein
VKSDDRRQHKSWEIWKIPSLENIHRQGKNVAVDSFN